MTFPVRYMVVKSKLLERYEILDTLAEGQLLTIATCKSLAWAQHIVAVLNTMEGYHYYPE